MEIREKWENKDTEKNNKITSLDDNLKVPTTEELSEDMKKNPSNWIYAPKGQYKEDLEIKDKVDIRQGQ